MGAAGSSASIDFDFLGDIFCLSETGLFGDGFCTGLGEVFSKTDPALLIEISCGYKTC